MGASRSLCTVSVMRPWCRRDVTTAGGTERVRLWVRFLPLAPRARIHGQEGAVLDSDCIWVTQGPNCPPQGRGEE